MTFRVGMKVVKFAGGEDSGHAGERFPIIGGVYTIASIEPSYRWPGESILVLMECDHRHRAIRFRPAVSPKQEISFTQGADPESERYDNRRPVVEPMPVDGWGSVKA